MAFRRESKLITPIPKKEWKNLCISIVRACFDLDHMSRYKGVFELRTRHLSGRDKSKVAAVAHLICNRSRQTPDNARMKEHESFIEWAMKHPANRVAKRFKSPQLRLSASKIESLALRESELLVHRCFSTSCMTKSL